MTVSDLCGEIMREMAAHHGGVPDFIAASPWQLWEWEADFRERGGNRKFTDPPTGAVVTKIMGIPVRPMPVDDVFICWKAKPKVKVDA